MRTMPTCSENQAKTPPVTLVSPISRHKQTVCLHDGDSVKFGQVTLKVLHTPGHSRGSIVLFGEKEAFSGDTLFAGSIGRTDFPDSSDCDMRLSLEKLLHLPDTFVIYPGHGPATTIGEEKRVNPFLQEFRFR